MSARAAIEIVRASGLALVQDRGRPGFLHMGVPPGGAMIPAALARANEAVGNDDDAAAIELVGALSIRARGALMLATDSTDAIALDDGATYELLPSPAIRYVAFAGGLDVPRVLGGRGTLLVAKVGGHEGRNLARGDVIELGATSRTPGKMARSAIAPDAPLRVVPGPDRDAFERGVETLLGSTFVVTARRDRVGVVLGGATIARRGDGPRASAPMTRGAIEVPPSGEPIVLGPDGPTTGGYPIVAVVCDEDVGALYARPVGAHVRFLAAGFV